jgi:MFS family permease
VLPTGLLWLGFAAGLALLMITWSSVVRTLLIPGYMRSAVAVVVAACVLAGFRLIARPIADLGRRERVLAAGPATFLLSLLGCWIACLYLSYALLLAPFGPGGVTGAARLSGSSLFTLGFATPSGAAGYVIAFIAAVSGIGVIALLIGYLPTLYAAYNRRETLVTMLEALSGTPPWGPELLARQRLILNVDYLGRLYERWAEWAADITESHASYRTLIYFRSRNPEQAWPLALLAVLDAAALHLALCPQSAPAEARPLLRIGFTAMRTIATTLRVPVNDDPHPDDPLGLTRAEFDAAIRHLAQAGWTFERSPDEAWPHVRGWRVNYETAAWNVAAHLDVPPAPWSGPRARLGAVATLPRRPVDRVPEA